MNVHKHEYERTVVRIHIKQATLAPMATAPAVPPRTADAEALAKISRKVGVGSETGVSLILALVRFVRLVRLVINELVWK